MDKGELIDRINAVREALRQGANKSVGRMLKQLSVDVAAEDIYTTLTVAGEPLVSQVASRLRGSSAEENARPKPVDHFAAWVNGTDTRSLSKDFSVENPGLHKLYVNWAHHHLLAINKAIKRLERFNNINLLDSIIVLNKCRKDLIVGSTAYRDAAALIVANIDPGPYTPIQAEAKETLDDY